MGWGTRGAVAHTNHGAGPYSLLAASNSLGGKEKNGGAGSPKEGEADELAEHAVVLVHRQLGEVATAVVLHALGTAVGAGQALLVDVERRQQ